MQDQPQHCRSSQIPITRRTWLGALGVGAASLGLDRLGLAEAAPAIAPPGRKRLLRLAHLTDVHIQPELGAAEGLAACLRHVQSQKDAPDLIINTGDCIFDALGQDQARTKLQWDLWHSVLKNECSLPIEHCIGNHDIWGWNQAASGATGAEPLYGKQWALDALGLAKPYRSFERNGWRFIVLDSMMTGPEVYRARLDDEQFDWLARELKASDPAKPVVILSHIPIFSAASMLHRRAERPEGTLVIDRAMHMDYRRIKDLFKQHANVKLCLSGHMHLVDRVDYLGVSYLCNGAVSGAWWKGSHMEECENGYTMLDLFDDGSFERQYVTFGWVSRPA